MLPFSRETILALDEDQVSRNDKASLLRKFFPPDAPASWKVQFREDWRLAGLLGERQSRAAGRSPAPFRVGNNELVREAQRLHTDSRSGIIERIRPGNRVIDYCNWLYGLYLHRPKSVSAIEEGKRAERAILGEIERRRVGRLNLSGWKMIYRGLADDDSAPLDISSLTVRGEGLRAKPDLVYREERTARILIVELKFSSLEMPLDGWPNLRGQLWAYSRIDDFATAPTVTVAGEVWYCVRDLVRPHGVISWTRGHPDLEEPNQALFPLYGGVVRAPH